MRVVVVGLGWVSQEVWLPRLLAHPKFQVVAAVEPNAETVVRARALIGDIPVHARHEDVPAGEVDGAFVLTPNHTHGLIGEWFLRQGCAVFLEKPTGTDRGQLDMLAMAARKGGGAVALSSAARHRADVATMRDVVASGALGTPRLAELSWVRSKGVPGKGWFTHRATSGGGVLVDLGWHLIDVAHRLWAPSPVRGAAAAASGDFLRRSGWDAGWRGEESAASTGADVEDQLTALVSTDAYAMNLRFAWASHEELDRTTIALHGTEGSLVLRTTFGFSPLRVTTPTLVLKRGGVVEELPLPAARIGDEYDRHLDALVDLWQDADATARALSEAHDVLAVVEACYRAAELT